VRDGLLKGTSASPGPVCPTIGAAWGWNRPSPCCCCRWHPCA